MKTKIYVGIVGDGTHKREMFRYPLTPTQDSHGNEYITVIGPFRTKAGAIFMRDYGHDNPHCQCVADAEKLAKFSASKEEYLLASKGQ